MNILAWLVRFQSLIKNETRAEMINAFRSTELPPDDSKQQKRYREVITGSEAILTASDVLKTAINNTYDMTNDTWLNKLINPLKILEVLLYNEEQVRLGFKKGFFMTWLCKLLTKIRN